MAQKKIPAPIDRPLSKAYLREFTGWSTEFPPGLSDPTSLRLMENVMINRDGSARVRPGLRYLSYTEYPEDEEPGQALDRPMVGTHEVFFLNDGTKAYLFAVREVDNTVGFRVLQLNGDTSTVLGLTDPGVSFNIPQGESVLNFSDKTTYVKYVQIDNKIFALSNAGEAMRLFYVGATKSARRLTSVERPEWSQDDKLTVVHPEATWIIGGTPISSRTNILKNPSLEGPLDAVATTSHTKFSSGPSVDALVGTKTVKVETTPSRVNLVGDPATDVATHGVGTWWGVGYLTGSGSDGTLTASGDHLLRSIPSGSDTDRNAYLEGKTFPVTPGQVLQAAYTVTNRTSGIQFFRGVFDFYNAAGVVVGSAMRVYSTGAITRHVFDPVTVPANAVSCRFQPYANTSSKAAQSFGLKDITVTNYGESTAPMSGADGAGYFWTGAAWDSASVYQPDQTTSVRLDRAAVAAGTEYSFTAKARITAAHSARLRVVWLNASDAAISNSDGSLVAVPADTWTALSVTATAPAGAVRAALVSIVLNLARGETYQIDEMIGEEGSSTGTYFDGDSANGGAVLHTWLGDAHASASTEVEYTAPVEAPDAETPTADTLISSDSVDNQYSFGMFYSFSTEIGESAHSQVTIVKTQRGWSQWKWETPNSNGEPSGTMTFDPEEAADQLVAIIPEEVFDQAVAQGATSWNLYLLTWSDQEVVPVAGVKVGSKELSTSPDYGQDGWLRVTSQSATLTEESAPLPNAANRYNYSNPSRAGQGLAASDRMVLVYDPVDAAVIRWSSAQQGEYTNFTANKGGGYKTLTSGNLFVPACVKLWQNPQSVDTLTVLCMGVDGYSTGYYMAPAQVAQQSEAVNIMAFEETTATPGTTSPYGCEVLNNALYHPLNEQLMKSTATNYNINHKSMTEQIQQTWSDLATKERIVSSQLDNRLYLIVNNPHGAPLVPGQSGNEVWVLDVASKSGTWSRWTVQAHSLRKIEWGGQVYMSLVSVNGIYFFDPSLSTDDYVSSSGEVLQRSIPWLLETNTQGANRAHDAWCHLRQLQLMVGNFTGSMRYGIRSWDQYGKPVEVSKVLRQLDTVVLDEESNLPFDYEDQLRIARDLKEWFFFAESLTAEDGSTLPSSGQLNAVQYRYTPVSVNVGYEYGSVETFEYQRASVNWAERTTDNGVPIPVNDVRRP